MSVHLPVSQAYTSKRCILIQVLPPPNAYLQMHVLGVPPPPNPLLPTLADLVYALGG